VATFCLVHGAWHDAACWDPLIEPLRAVGHEAVAPTLAFDDPATTFDERVAPARDAIGGRAGPLVVVGHSMGAGYAPAIAAAREDAVLVQLCPGLGPRRPGFPWPPTRPDGTSAWDPDAAIAALYPRLRANDARRLAARLRPMAPAAGGYPRGRAMMPACVVIALDDELFDPASERTAALERLGVEPIELAGGHFPMVEDPENLTRLLAQLARERA
jgi:pimeloyl-ACP methyl ester carboxylesterase